MQKKKLRRTSYIGRTYGGVPELLDKMRSYVGVQVVVVGEGKDKVYHIYGDWTVPGNEVAKAMNTFRTLEKNAKQDEPYDMDDWEDDDEGDWQ